MYSINIQVSGRESEREEERERERERETETVAKALCFQLVSAIAVQTVPKQRLGEKMMGRLDKHKTSLCTAQCSTVQWQRSTVQRQWNAVQRLAAQYSAVPCSASVYVRT